MNREEWIKLRDRAAKEVLSLVSMINPDSDIGFGDKEAGFFWCNVHLLAVRELACIPHPTEQAEWDKMLQHAENNLQIATTDSANRRDCIKAALAYVQDARAWGGAS